MKVSRIISAMQNSSTPQIELKDKKTKTQNFAYNPMAYVDYNVSFGKRWPSVKAFYEQKYVQENMPNMMKNLLNLAPENINMRPAELMQKAYAKLNDAKSLEHVKEIITQEQEPLFSSLTSKPISKLKEGIVAEIEIMKQEPKYAKLFKDNDDDLGLYLLKKVFVEGKSTKEINADFQTVIRDEYKGLSPITDDTFRAFGIIRPSHGKIDELGLKNAGGFWHSFLYAREDFPYTYERKTVNNVISTVKEKVENAVVKELPIVKRQGRKFTETQISDMSEFMKEYWKNLSPEEYAKRVKRLKLHPDQEVFFNKFKGPIFTIAADKINLSQKMADYFAQPNLSEKVKDVLKDVEVDDLLNFENPSSKTKIVVKAFWRDNPDLGAEYGKAIKETTKELEEQYNADTSSFESLLESAINLKKEKYARMKERYLERSTRNNDSQKTQTAMFGDHTSDVLDVDGLVNKATQKAGIPNGYKMVVGDNEYHFLGNLQEELKKNLAQAMKTLPSGYTSNFSRFVQKHKQSDDKFIVSLVLAGREEAEQIPNLIPFDELAGIIKKMRSEFIAANPSVENSKNQVLAETLIKVASLKNGKLLFQDTNFLEEFMLKHKEKFTPEIMKQMNNSFNSYRQPLSTKEIQAVKNSLMDYIRNVDSRNMLTANTQNGSFLEAAAINIKNLKQAKDTFLSVFGSPKLNTILSGDYRYVLDKNVDKSLKDAKLESLFLDLVCTDKKLRVYLAGLDENVLNSVVAIKNPELANSIRMQFALL